MQVKIKENSTVVKYSGTLVDFEPTRDELDILVPFKELWSEYIIQLSLGGLVMIEDINFVLKDEKLRLIDFDDDYLQMNMTILIFKQPDEGEVL